MGIVCVVSKLGHVMTLIQTTYMLHCVPDWSNWPYDVHTCEMTMGERDYMKSKFQLDFMYKVSKISYSDNI